jgi:ABC-2 type transport system ATP-binding protein
MPTIIESRALVKRFGRVEALRGVDLDVDAGGVTALLGPNGAGKTTFVRAVATLVRPDGGTLRVDGHDVVAEAKRVRTCIGLAGQHASVEAAMTGRENLRMIARLYGQDRRAAHANADRVLDQLDLLDAADRLVRTYSGGMRRRLDLGASLVGAPRLLLLDEPTTGLDPRSRLELWDTIRGLADRGTDVLLTTQYLDEADHLAGRVVIIDRGRVIADGSPAALKAQAGRDVIEVHTAQADSLGAASRVLQRVGGAEPRVDAATRKVSISADGPDLLPQVVRALDDEAVAIEDIALRRPTLDEVFLVLTGRATPDGEPDDTPTGTPTGAPAPDAPRRRRRAA